jgi:hypothetical protein
VSEYVSLHACSTTCRTTTPPASGTTSSSATPRCAAPPRAREGRGEGGGRLVGSRARGGRGTTAPWERRSPGDRRGRHRGGASGHSARRSGGRRRAAAGTESIRAFDPSTVCDCVLETAISLSAQPASFLILGRGAPQPPTTQPVSTFQFLTSAKKVARLGELKKWCETHYSGLLPPPSRRVSSRENLPCSREY